MPVVRAPHPTSRAGTRYCRRCGAEIRVSASSALGVACARCGSVSPTNGLVRGASVNVPRPTELRAFHIAESEAPSPRRGVPRVSTDGIADAPVRAIRRSASALAAAWRAVAAAVRRANRSFDAVGELMLDWPTRTVISIATVAFAAGLGVLMVALMAWAE